MIGLKKMTVLCASLMIIAGCAPSSTNNMRNEDVDDMSSSTMAPPFSMVDLKGETHQLSDYKGKKVYLKLWASWCPICLSGLEELDALIETTTDYEVLTIVAPNYRNEKNSTDFTSWFTSLKYKNIQVLLDNDGTYMQKLNVRGYPTSVFIDTSGNLSKIQPGHLNKDQIDEVMASLT